MLAPSCLRLLSLWSDWFSRDCWIARGCGVAATAAILMLASPAVLQGQTAPTPVRFLLSADDSRVWFEGRANMGGVRGEARQVEGWAETTDTLSFRDAEGAVEIHVASFRTGIRLRDRHLRDEMDADSFPVIRFSLHRIEAPVAATAAAARQVTLYGTLTIKRTTREVAIPARLTEGDEGVDLVGELPLRLTEYGIEPPVRLGGLARMRDELTVQFDLLFLPAGR